MTNEIIVHDSKSLNELVTSN